MTFLRPLLCTLLLAALLAPSAARADEEEDQAQLFVSVFSMMCPSVMAEGLTGEGGLGAVDDPLPTAISGVACECIDTRFKAMSSREVMAMMEQGEASKPLEGMFSDCVAIAVKPRIGEACRVYATRFGADADDPVVTAGCSCAQERADALSVEQMSEIMRSEDDQSLAKLVSSCEIPIEFVE